MNIVTLILNNGNSLSLLYAHAEAFHDQRRDVKTIDDRLYYEFTDDNSCFVTVDVKNVSLLGIQPQFTGETPTTDGMGGTATVN